MLRPLFLVLAYRQASFIAEAVRAALDQKGVLLDILISDDCSGDETWSVIESVVQSYDGPHNVRINRNERNLGLIGHLNQCLDQTEAQHVIVGAGDDVSIEDRAKRCMDSFAATDALLVHSDIEPVDDKGNPVDYAIRGALSETTRPEKLARSLGLYVGATGAWNREIFTKYGPLPEGVYEDLIFGFRAALEDRVAYIDDPLVKYRANMGLSALPGAGLSDEEWLQDRRAAIQRGIRTFKQRIEDANTAGLTPQSRTMRVLAAKLREYQARDDVLGLTGPEVLQHRGYLKPGHLRAWWSERKRESKRH